MILQKITMLVAAIIISHFDHPLTTHISSKTYTSTRILEYHSTSKLDPYGERGPPRPDEIQNIKITLT